MSAVNGVPVILKVEDADGTTSIERPVFATVRRCPALLGKIQAIGRATVREAVTARRASDAAGRLADCPEDQVDAVSQQAQDASDALGAATAAVFDAIRDFVVTGFTGAGYTTDQAERLASIIPHDRLGELRAACQLGCGVLDFTKPAQT